MSRAIGSLLNGCILARTSHRPFTPTRCSGEPDELVWYVDGVEQFRSKQGVPAEPMILIANLAIGGWAGPPNAETAFPAYLDIDYIHVYQRPGQ